MPRVHYVQKARKDNPAVKAGEPYYWWKFRHGGKRYSKTRPRPSQLTQSPYYGAVRSLVERIEDETPNDWDDFESLRDEIKDEIEALGQECQDNLDNMPDSLQYSPTGELLQERIDACDNAVMEIESIDEFEFDEDEVRDDLEDDDGNVDEEELQSELERRYTNEFSDWVSDAKSELSEYVGNCEV